jgi:hypothetical protein
MGESRGVCRVLVGKSEGKRPLGRPRCRWKDTIKMDSYNRSQQVALFLNFILMYNSTCSRQIYCPSSEVLILFRFIIPVVFIYIKRRRRALS